MTTDRLEPLLRAHIERLHQALGQIIAITGRTQKDPAAALVEIDRIAVRALAVAVEGPKP